MSGRRVFHTLDALRGVAAIGVVMFHMQPVFLPIAVPGGYLAVDLFFMMSGVVLSHAYEARFQSGMNTFEFMRIRLIRLYPLYLLGLALGITVAVASMLGRNSQNWGPWSLAQAGALALLFLPNLSARQSSQLFPLNIPCWSLFFELVVNLLFVATWPLLTSRRLTYVAVLSGTVMAVATLQHGNMDIGSTASGLLVGMARTLFGFTIGVLIARYMRHERRRESNLAVLGILAVFGVCIMCRPDAEMRAAWDLVCVLAGFPALVWWSTQVDPRQWLCKAAAFLGATSYAVYVLHSPLSAVLNSVWGRVAGAGGVLLAAPWIGLSVLALLLAGCWLADRIYDIPVRRTLNRAFSRKVLVRAEPGT